MGAKLIQILLVKTRSASYKKMTKSNFWQVAQTLIWTFEVGSWLELQA